MRADEVKPRKWLWDVNYPIKVLYDDGSYSVIWGKYEKNKALGVRWNRGETEIGYPSQGGYPTWYVEPDFIAISILERILTLAEEKNESDRIDDINFAISELDDNIKSAQQST